MIIPQTKTEAALEWLLETADLVLRLYSNNYTPNPASVIGSFTQVTGGGYAAITLDKDEWTITAGAPSVALQSQKQFSFSGATGGSGAVYGFYITDVAGTILYGAEALPSSVSPFTPASGTYIRITPQVQCSGGV